MEDFGGEGTFLKEGSLSPKPPHPPRTFPEKNAPPPRFVWRGRVLSSKPIALGLACAASHAMP